MNSRPDLAAAAPELAEARFALLFGSGVDPDQLRPDSDLDFAVDFGTPLGLEERLELAVRLARATRRECDIVDLPAAGPIVKMQVVRNGIVVAVRDPAALAAFRARTPLEYEDFKRERSAAEAALTSRLSR
jgi:predicted nucleotidyltransferase